MNKQFSVGAFVVTLALLSVAVACDKSPTRPGTGDGNSTTRLEISGPDTIAPGAQAQYTLTAFLPNGTTRDATANGSWRSSTPSVAGIDQSGRATGQRNGETIISASVAASGSAKTVMVLPAGTFRVKGRVVDESTSENVRSAEVRIRPASGPDLRTTTNPSGEFTLYGVPADAELEVASFGYVRHTEVLRLLDHATLQIRLKRGAPGTEVPGAYRLTVTAGTCRPSLPGRPPLAAELRSRTYDAVITQNGSTIDVTLSDAEFFTRDGKTSNRFSAWADRNVINVYLHGPDSYYYEFYLPYFISDVIERLPDGTFLITSGFSVLNQSPYGWRANLQGSLWHRATVPNGTILGVCSSDIALDFTK